MLDKDFFKFPCYLHILELWTHQLTNLLSLAAEFRLRHVRKATFLVMMLFAFMQLSGLNNVLFYMEIILVRSKSTIMKPSNAVSYVLTCAVVTAIVSIGLYDRCGRRSLLMVSSIGVSTSLVALGTHFVLLENGVEWVGSQYLPVASLFLFITAFVIGFNSIPSIVSSEVYAANIKSVAACIANIVAAAAAFFSSKAYQPLVDMFGEAYVFYGHAIITFMAVPYAIFIMPETKGKTLQQIQEDLIKTKWEYVFGGDDLYTETEIWNFSDGLYDFVITVND